MSVTQSLIFNSKEEASTYLKNINKGHDGKHMIARYWTSGEGSDIASVEGILHRTNGVRNVEIKDGNTDSISEQLEQIFSELETLATNVENTQTAIEDLSLQVDTCCS